MFACSLLLTAAANAQRVVSPSNDHIVDRWGVEEGLGNNALTSVIRTRDGYLLIGSWAGILRFGGVRFTPIAEDRLNVHARVLLEDRDGSVWIGASGAGLVRWRPGHVERFTTAQGLAGNDVLALAHDEDGRVWVGTEGGMSVIAAGRVTSWRRGQGLPDGRVTGITRGRDGRMWIATTKGVCEARRGEFRCERLGAPMGTPTVAVEDRAGRLWIGTRGTGLFETRGGESPASECAKGCLERHDVTALLEARDGGMWVGLGWTGGVALVRDGRVTHYRASDGVPPFPVEALYEDPEGSLWIATDNGGLARLRPKRVRTYSTANGLPAAVATSIVQDTRGAIWAGSRCGPVAELRNDRFEPRFAELTRDACSYAVLAARDGSLWIGTQTIGLFRWDGRRMRQFDRDDGLSDSGAVALFEDRDGVVWIGTERGGVHRFADGRLSRAFDRKDGVATGYIVTFAQDRDGRIWIGSNANGLTVYEDGRFRTLGRDGLPTGNVAGLLVDSRGDLWIGTAAHGLFRRRNGRYESFGREQGLGDMLVALMLEDGEGNLWVSTTRGIARLERARIEAVAAGRAASLDPIILDRGDGLLHLEGSGGGFDPSGLRARDGRLWFSTLDGIVVVDPATFRTNRVPPPVLIEGGLVDGGPARRDGDGTLHVPAGTEAIELSYTGLSLLAPPKVRFKYRLGGADSTWHDAQGRRTAYYSRLAPGEYTFEVMAANNDGMWSTSPATARLVVAPLWWERRAVQGGALTLLLIVVGYGVRAVSLRRARARVAALEREQALNRERSRIARDLHDDLGARLAHIALIAETGQSAPLERISGAAREAMQTMDELVWTVNARNDTVENFASYATQFAEEHLRAAGVRCRFRVQADLDGRELNADTRRHLYLAFKEAVTNAVKHAQPSAVRISLGIEGGTLVLEVADDGCGLAPGASDPTGNGLKNMRERMLAIGGTLVVDSAPGRGARVVFRAPLNPLNS